MTGGECQFTRYGLRGLIGGVVFDAPPVLAVSGGFSPWLDILALAKIYGVGVIPHPWGSGIAGAAALYAMAPAPHLPRTTNPLPFLKSQLSNSISNTIRFGANSARRPRDVIPAQQQPWTTAGAVSCFHPTSFSIFVICL